MTARPVCWPLAFLASALLVLTVAADRGASSSSVPAVVFERGGDLYAISIDGARKVRLTRTRAIETHPRVSPDGKTIAFIHNRNDNYLDGDLSTMLLDGSHRRTLTRGRASDPTWGPRGTTLYFVRYVQRGDEDCGRLARMPSSGGRVHTLRIAAPPHSSGFVAPAVSPDGRRIAMTDWDMCSGGTASPQLLVVDTRGRRTRDLRLLRDNGFYPKPEHDCPAWSPDGKRLAFLHNSDLAVANRNGSGERRIVRGFGYLIYECPAWSPDGRWIALSMEDKHYRGVLAIVRPDGSGYRRLSRADDSFSVGGWLSRVPR